MRDTINHLLTEAAALQSAGRFDEAAACYQHALDTVPHSARALLLYGRLLLQQGRHARAGELIGRALELEPHILGGATAMGIVHSNLDRIDEAIASFIRALTQDCDDLQALSSLGILLSFDARFAEAVPYYQRAIARAPDDPELHNGLGVALVGLGNFEQAVAALQRAVTLAPEVAEAHNNLGLALSRLDRPADAVASLQRAIALQPDYADAHVNLAAALQECGDSEAAIRHCEQALALQPDLANGHVTMANALRALGRLSEAADRYRRALEIEPDHAVAMLNLGLVLIEGGDIEAAIAQFQHALTLRPDFVEAHHGLGRALRRVGRYREAIDHLDRALVLRPDLADAYADKGNALKELGQLDAARQAIETAIVQQPARPEFYHDLAECVRFTAGNPYLVAMEALAAKAETLPDDGRTALYFALGKAYADLGDAARSFAALQSGNALKRRQVEYDEATTLAVLEHTRATFTPALFRARRGSGNPSPVPIFIVGMPRSGSTLVEQILASHPDVYGAGEVSAFHDAVARLAAPDGAPAAYPAMVPQLTNAQLEQLGARYLATLTEAAPSAQRITDKLLANFRFLGLIHLALPNARVIHTRRDPVDTCLSCFSKLFAGVLPYTYDLAELGRYYHGYARLMAHWREVLPAGVMLEVDYEDVVADLEGAARRIVAHCGLQWDARCLDFHTTDRPVRTASVVQVRQPIYRAAVGRWRPYAPMLQPLLEALGPDPSLAGASDVGPIFATAQALQQDRPDDAETLYRELLLLDPGHADALRSLGALRLKAGKAAEAMSLLREAVRLRPELGDTHYNLGLALQALGEHSEAMAAFQQAIDRLPDPAEPANSQRVSLPGLRENVEAIAGFDHAGVMRPDFADAYNNRANALLAAQRPAEAIAAYQRALAHRPDFIEAHSNLGLTLQILNRHQEARNAFECVLALDPTHPTAHCSLGKALQACGEYAQAIAMFEQALALRPDDAEAWSKLGLTLAESGRLEDARRAHERAIAIAPRNTLYYRHLTMTKRLEPGDPHLAAMEALADDLGSLRVADQVDLHFALGNAYGDLRRHQDSFRHLLAGNALVRRQTAYDEAGTLAVFERIRGICSPELMRAKAGAGDPSHLPVFIVGMPRSGTTLLEQILASHPRVFGAGEILAFEGALSEVSGQDGSPRKFIEALPDAPDEVLRQTGSTYVGSIRALAREADRVTNKMPPNYLFVGPIHLALPNARIIHVRRDPIDTCLSCFSKLFAGPVDYAYDLGELGRYYRAYERLMAHWREVLPPGVMLEVDYEDVVADLEGAARRVVAHCGLPWDARCLAFHEVDRPVRTASVVQVRQPLYRSAIGRWRPYAPMLRPLLDALGVG